METINVKSLLNSTTSSQNVVSEVDLQKFSNTVTTKITLLEETLQTKELLEIVPTLSEGTTALKLKTVTGTVECDGGATEVITLSIPSGAMITGAQLRNNTLLTATTGVSYSAAYSGGATQSIGTGIAFTKNTKTSTFFTVQGSGEATNITSATTNITLTPNAGTLDTGTVEAVVYYWQFDTPSSVA
jgi:hypothetical protein